MSNQGTPPLLSDSTTTLASRGIQPRFSELGQSCRKLVLNHLADNLSSTFAQVDDTLFDCAEKAENNQVQTLFFDHMRSIRKLRSQIERHFHQAVSQGFSDFLDGRLKSLAVSTLQAEDLALIQHDEYEENLQVTHMASRTKARNSTLLFALEQRLALLNGGRPLSEEDNPFAPLAIAQAFRQALASCDFPLRIKIVLYTLFDSHVMHALDKLYAALNQRLIEAGILPNLKEAPVRSSAPTAGHSSQTDPTAAAEQPADAAEQHYQLELDQLLEGLHVLLAEQRDAIDSSPLYRGTPSMESFAPQGASQTYSKSALLEALNRMQFESAQELAQRRQVPVQVAGLKADLQRQLASFSDAPLQHRLDSNESDVIDLVGMLFDFILDDSNLPNSYKTALSHLHTPYLKIALQDKALFTRRHHPARKLLNAMAQAGVLYGSDDDEQDLLHKVHWVVEQVIQRFDGDLQILDSLLGEFNDFTATIRQRSELRERRAVEAAKGRDKLLSARYAASQSIAQSLAKRTVPAIIRQFLERTWIDVLVFIQLRHGPTSEEWRRASLVAEQLAWSGTLLDEAGQERLQKQRVEMLDALRKGLLLLGGYHDDDIRRLLQDLVACQHAVQGGQPQLAAKLPLPNAPSALGAMLGEEAYQSPQGNSLSAQAKNLVRELEQLDFGTWFEFTSNGHTQTLKLSWFSPTTHNYLFVDHNGQQAAIKSVDELAREMEQGTARRCKPDRTSPVVDRALVAVQHVLQQLTGRTP